MAVVRVGINGFGRIGRNVFRAAQAAVDDPTGRTRATHTSTSGCTPIVSHSGPPGTIIEPPATARTTRLTTVPTIP